MTYANGQIVVRVALALGPTDTLPVTVDDPAWTNLTDRVKSYRDVRGRNDPLQRFQPGSAQVVLDNGDRALDPSNTDGLLWDGSDRIGLPLCPVQIDVAWNGTLYPKFYGYLGPEAWPGDVAPKGPSGETTLHVVDALGHSPELPQDVWGIMLAALQPDWWMRMDDIAFPVLDDASQVPDYITGGHATMQATYGISRPYADAEVGGVGQGDPGLRMSGDHFLRTPAAGIMPDGDEASMSFACYWRTFALLGAGETATVLQCIDPVDSTQRFVIYVDGDDGLAYVETYDAGGTLIDSASISPFASSRWDQGQGHVVVARYDGGSTQLKVWFGGVLATVDCASLLYESDLIIGPSDVDVLVDEVAVWRRLLSISAEVAQMTTITLYGVWSGDTWGDRLGRWIETTGRTVTSDDTNEWHLTDDTTLGLWGLLRPARRTIENTTSDYSATIPSSLADAYQTTASYGYGAAWATKAGNLRFRTIHALTDSGYAEHYATPVLFTDAETLGTDEYRHAGAEVTGERVDRVINDAAVSYLYSDTPPAVGTSSPMTNRAIDFESQRRYGRRRLELTSEWCDWVLNQSAVDQIVARYAQPFQEFERVHLDPLGDDDLAAWLIVDCELEKACDVTYTPAGADPIAVTGLNIQQIAWDWTPERWSVDLVVAAS